MFKNHERGGTLKIGLYYLNGLNFCGILDNLDKYSITLFGNHDI